MSKSTILSNIIKLETEYSLSSCDKYKENLLKEIEELEKLI